MTKIEQVKAFERRKAEIAGRTARLTKANTRNTMKWITADAEGKKRLAAEAEELGRELEMVIVDQKQLLADMVAFKEKLTGGSKDGGDES